MPSIQRPLSGDVLVFEIAEEHHLGPGQLLAAGPGIRHRVASDDGATFLLTVAHPERVE